MSQIRPTFPRLNHFEDALQQTGWGLYYKFLVGFTCFNLFASGFALLCVHLALPLSACDTILDVTSTIDIFIFFNVGRSVGGFLLASTADNNGKRCMIPKSLIIIFASCFTCAFSHNRFTIYIAALFLGSGLEGNKIAIKILLTEILPKNRRAVYNILGDFCWTCGYFTSSVFLYSFGWQNSTNHHGMDMRLTSWRIIFAISGGLCITMACASALLETSPRFLLFKRRIITASLILKQFYAINKSKYSETFEIHSQQLVDIISDFDINKDPEPVGVCQQIAVMIKVSTRIVRVLLSKRFLKFFLMATLIRLPNLIGTPGWSLSFAHLLTPNNSTQSISGYQFLYLQLHKNEDDTGCSIFFDKLMFENFFLISLNIFLAQLVLLLTLEQFGRKLAIFAGLTLCSSTSIVLAFSENYSYLTIVSSIFIFAVTILDCTINVYVIESFPTAVRGTATALSQLHPLLISCAIYKIPEIPRLNFYVIVATMFFGSSIVTCFIPEMKKRPMVE